MLAESKSLNVFQNKKTLSVMQKTGAITQSLEGRENDEKSIFTGLIIRVPTVNFFTYISFYSD